MGAIPAVLIADSRRRAGAGPKARRRSQALAFRQPGEHVAPRGIDGAALRPMMGVFNNLVMYEQDVAQNSLQSIVPDLATGWSWNEEGTELTFPLRQGVKWHDGKPFTAAGRQMHLGPADRQGEREASHQSAQILVQQPRGGDHERRLRGHLPPEAAAARAARAAGLRLVADLSLPCRAARHAQPSDRHRPVQIRRVQAERGDPGDQKSGLLERRAGPISTASNGRSSETCRRATWRSSPASSTCTSPHGVTIPIVEGYQEPGAAGDLRGDADKRQPHADHQPRTSRPSTIPICGGRWR